MPRIVGVDIPENKRIEASLQYIYGVGSTNVKTILKLANIDPDKRAKDLTDQEILRIVKSLETIPTEGVLRKIVSDNIQRLKQIRTYRGIRHMQRLPVRGQRTRVNARTKRGKRLTVGALTKEMAQKLDEAKKAK
ncbi:30S ribosomal protein S13 [Candidatus Beckwithbacteria bacterium]|nr:30S ribosomal protein S13 [Candidatus Beckwithbacteria bacterium]